MANTAHDGRPYAGDPHVRIDVGDGASAKPRRSSAKLLESSKILVAAGVLGASFAAVQAETLDSHSYVQTGLTACFDGIDNAGTGTHDATATAWANLANAQYSATMGANISWVDKGWSNSVDGKPMTFSKNCAGSVINSKNFTIEFACKPSRANRRQAFFSQWAGAGFSIEHNAGPYSSGHVRIYFDGYPDLKTSIVFGANEDSSITVGVSNSEQTAWRNGVKKYGNTGSIGGQMTAASPVDPVIGGDPNRTAMAFFGIFHAFRLYSGVLTEDQIKFNAAIDAVRFRNEDPTTVALPDGYRITAAQDLQVRVSTAVEGQGTVTLNGADGSSGVYVSRKGEVTLNAMPADGWEFVRWLGVADDGPGGTETVATVMEPKTFIAVFRQTSWDNPTVDYVRYGMVAWFDGKDNAGTGVHDPAATTWVDLSGNGNDATMGANVVWAETGWTNGVAGRPATLGPAVSQMMAGKICTVDFACRPHRQTARESYFSQYNNADFHMAIEHNSGAPHCAGGFRLYSRKQLDILSENAFAAAEEEVSLSAVFAQPGMGMWKNGILCDWHPDYVLANAPPTNVNWVIGGEPFRDTMAFVGEFHSFRLYNRALTETELAINAAVDALRYRGIPFEDVRLPVGCSFDANTNILVNVKLQTWGPGKIRVDGGDAVKDREFTMPVNGPILLDAEPNSGFVFAGWQGDLDLIARGDADSATIVVARARPLSLMAKFRRPDGSAADGFQVIICRSGK